jgi:hypothetical protein
MGLPATNAKNEILGRPSLATGPIGTTTEVTAIINYGYTAGTSPFANQDSMPAAIRALGDTDNLDVLLRCNVAECLVNPAGAGGGRTIFDSCKDVVFDECSFKVTAVDRTGLPPYGPYVLWVALKKNGVVA